MFYESKYTFDNYHHSASVVHKYLALKYVTQKLNRNKMGRECLHIYLQMIFCLHQLQKTKRLPDISYEAGCQIWGGGVNVKAVFSRTTEVMYATRMCLLDCSLMISYSNVNLKIKTTVITGRHIITIKTFEQIAIETDKLIECNKYTNEQCMAL